jgi:dTDP-4-amino-4,6-dideoxygalactose transaminase
MQEIRMVDLKNQYQKIKKEIDNAIQEVINTTAFIKGPDVRLFEDEMSEYLKVKHVITCANGTDALQVAMMALGLKPGDEVITTGFTFIATVEVVALLGLKIVLVDVDPDSFNIIPEEIEKAITAKTKAIIPVHLFGQSADMEKIMKIAARHNLFVIEDTAQATGTDYIFRDGTIKKAGTIGTIGCTSFFPSKNLGCFGDGGALYTNNDALAKLLYSIINHGMTIKYYHDHVGVNSRLDTLQAAILRVKLKSLDRYNQARRRAADFYDKEFANHPKIKTPSRSIFSTHIFHQYTIVLNNVDRDELMQFLANHGIPTMIYYPVPMHLQKAYRNLGYKQGDFPVTESLSHSVLSLPMHSELDNEQLGYITSTMLKYLEK